MSKLIATFFYVGYLKPAPGTWGSAAAIPFAWVLHAYTGIFGLVAGTIAAFVIGYWATAKMTAGQDNHDPSEIVIDEVVGVWIALWPLSLGLTLMGQGGWAFPYPGWIGAFVLFRIFDIWKPGPVGWADRKHGPMGVMLDDVIAGVLAALVLTALGFFAHQVLM